MNEYEIKAFKYLIIRLGMLVRIMQSTQCKEAIEIERDALSGVIGCMESQSIISFDEYERLLDVIYEF